MKESLFAVGLFTACWKHYAEREGKMYTSPLRTHFFLHRPSLLKPQHSKVTPSCNCMPLRAEQQELIVCVCRGVCVCVKGVVGVKFSPFSLLRCPGSCVEDLVYLGMHR